MMKSISIFLLFLFLTLSTFSQEKEKDIWSPDNFSGLEFRSIGPALMAGRIADIAIHPENENIWYVAVGSGGVWKTKNAGTTWKPLFDKQKVYSTGCITIDPHNPNTIYVGTGENVGGRHVGFGDGLYRSLDGGETWKNIGLKRSEHISKIIVHHTDVNTIYVAAQGPLWSKGCDRGLYISKDFGKTWTKTLGDNEWTGVTDICYDKRNPNTMYAATWQRHRTTAAYMGGGPGSGIYRSLDGGDTWDRMKTGLPESNMGKIGLAISPHNPDVIYAAIELDLRTGGVYRSINRGQSWEKRSDAVAGATGPHYYQELYACPHHEGRIYLVDVRMQVSNDGGKTFHRMNEKNKHSDNHVVVFRKDDPEYLLVGTDGGIYETLDGTEHWRFIANMPITQFYKLAVDDSQPFYKVYGGTQDNSTEGGPSRTDNMQGIQNSDWRIVLNWDGHQPATEPGNPNIMYGQRQEGTLSRIDLTTGEVIDIQPQEGEGENYERYNWDAPILVSPHDAKQIFFASQRLWRSNDRGDHWQAISGDLTHNQNRLEIPIMGRKQSWNNPWDFLAMSNYNTITSIAESNLARDHIMIGTDDGLIQYTADGGENWRSTDISRLSGVPKTAYINDIKSDLFEANTWYIALDNHKAGDFKPYLFMTTDNGKSWKSISSNLPEVNLVWRIVQDHVDMNLLFIGTEFGIYFTQNGGQKWIQLKGGLPTISFRDLTIQRRENDLVCASFGRSFYILDDYSSLRDVDDDVLKKEAHLFPVKEALWYVPRPHLSFGSGTGSQGSAHFLAKNPPYGAVFTAYVGVELKTDFQKRKEIEKELNKEGKDVPFPGWDVLDEEAFEKKAELWFVVKNAYGEVIRKIKSEAKKGFQRVAWDLRYPNPNSLKVGSKNKQGKGFLAPPGDYSVEMYVHDSRGWRSAGSSQNFNLRRLSEGALEGSDQEVVSVFFRRYEAAVGRSSRLRTQLSHATKKIASILQAFERLQAYDLKLDSNISQLRKEIYYLDIDLNGSKIIKKPGEKTNPTLGSRMFAIARGVGNSTYGPTSTHIKQMEIVEDILSKMKNEIESISKRLDAIVESIVEADGEWVE